MIYILINNSNFPLKRNFSNKNEKVRAHTDEILVLCCGNISHYIIIILVFIRGTLWHSWLRHCSTRRKVAGSILDGVIKIFHSLKPYCPWVASASNPNEYQRCFLLRGKGGLHVPIVQIFWEPQPPGALRTCPGL